MHHYTTGVSVRTRSKVFKYLVMLCDISIHMKSYEEAVQYGKRSMEYATSRSGLSVLKSVITSGLVKVNDKRKSTLLSRGTTLFNLYEEPSKSSSTVSICRNLEELLKEIDESLITIGKRRADANSALFVNTEDLETEVNIHSPMGTGRSLLRRNTRSTARLDNFQLAVPLEVESKSRFQFCIIL